MISGTGSNSTDEAVELSQYAEKAGSDALLVVTPYYNKPTQEGLYQHYKKINDNVGIPIIIYNIPSRSVIDMSVETMSKLYELKNIDDESVDIFIDSCAVTHFKPSGNNGWKEVAENVYRSLKPGGKFIVSSDVDENVDEGEFIKTKNKKVLAT